MGLFGLGGGEVSGYNATEVEALADVISSTAQKAGAGIVERLHNEIVVPMSSVWYAPEAQEFCQKFSETVACLLYTSKWRWKNYIFQLFK